ncbi:VOC family protein [Pseudarthrobacter sp. NIBRBAC000502770]|uniref:VOC family protein n=1 Tax=Pseudarthrobacter sp. NIBRBAC000502770 TaxID=2590785 RepID=UPI00114045FF|nr:VOC family protein [Pseudarthrobacter sp. NIBRBAC000502770]QDG89387.1 VOC family protein [Pseudarthrobacter sp. NIBRBAC000502770]
MPKPTFANGDPCWIDLMTSDPEKSREFYTALFGWTYEEGDQEKYGGYITAFANGAMVAGMMKNDAGSGYPDVWTTYLRVEDIQATADAAVAAGGQVLMGPMEVPEQGHMAMLGDAGGAAIGAWQFGGHTGFQSTGEPGTPYWHELHARDYAASVKFYQDVFGWDTDVMSDTEDFRYTTLGSGRDSRAGIMDASHFLPEGVPANWQTYFAVENTDAGVEIATSLGGQVVHPAEDTPFGRIAALTDPTGALFRIAQR